jgi:prolipoprotein diacylglyceryltransferase
LTLAPVIGAWDVTEAQVAWFGVVLALGLLFTFAMSPRRRRAIGGARFMAGRALILCAALFGVVVVRGAVALGHVEAGENPFLAQLTGIFWGGAFAFFARLALILFPPTAWLLKEHRRAHREASFLRAFVSGAPAR